MKKYQIESPSDEDLFFHEGGHKHVSAVIKSLLIQNQEQHIIGIEGALGGGKSSIIKMLKNELDYFEKKDEFKEKKFHISIFDVDRYHTDLKVSLIEHIASELEKIENNREKLTTDKWKRRNYFHSEVKSIKDLALGRKFEYERETNSIVKPLVVFFALSLALMSGAIKPFYDTIQKLCEGTGSWKVFGFFSFFIALPVVLMLANFKKIGNLFNRSGIDRISEIITINKNVGPVELEKAFRDFDKLIPKDFVFVLVLDNIDRLSSEDIKTIWSELDLFTALSTSNFRILLPYCEDITIKALADSDKKEALEVAKEYISKRLPVVFYTPPVITFGWKKQFKNYYQETLSNLNNTQGIIELIEIWKKDKITPRFLKNFVNKIATKIDSCPEGHTLDAISVASYIFAHDYTSDSEKNENTTAIKLMENFENSDVSAEDKPFDKKIILTQKVLAKYIENREIWNSQIMRLHFQTSEDVAKNELLETPIMQCITTPNVEEFLNLKKMYAFEQVFNECLEKVELIQLALFFEAYDVFFDYANSPEEKEWMIRYIPKLDINSQRAHILADENYIPYLKAVLTLTNSGLKPSLYFVKKIEGDTLSKIKELCKHSENNISYSENSILLQEKIRILNNTYSLTNESYYFLEPKNEYIFFHALWPMRREIESFMIENNLKNYINIEYCNYAYRTYSNVNSEELISIFSEIINKNKIVFINQNTSQIEYDESLSIHEKIVLLPFSKDWNEQSTLVTLIQKLYEIDRDHANHMPQYLALIVACCANNYSSIADSITMYTPNGAQQRDSIFNVINNYIQKYPNYTDYLTAFLSFSKSFTMLMGFISNSKPHINFSTQLLELINTDKVYEIDIEEILTQSYSILKDASEVENANIILEFLATWKQYFPDFLDWSSDIISDLKTLKNKDFLNKILEYYDSEENNIDFWKTNITSQSITFIDGIEILYFNSIKLNHQTTLLDFIQSSIEDDENIINIPQKLLELLSYEKIEIIKSSIDNKFNSTSTEQEKRKWLIKNFDIFSPSKSTSKKVINIYLNFIYGITSSEKYIIIWISKINFKNRNINKYSLNDLEKLITTLKKLDAEIFKDDLKYLEELLTEKREQDHSE